MLGNVEGRAGPVAGEHVVRAALVGGLAVRHRAADGDLVGDLGRVLEQFVEEHAVELGRDRAQLAAVLDRGERLGIEGVLMGHAAGQEDVDDRLGRGGLGGAGRGGLGGAAWRRKNWSSVRSERRRGRRAGSPAGSAPAKLRGSSFQVPVTVLAITRSPVYEAGPTGRRDTAETGGCLFAGSAIRWVRIAAEPGALQLRQAACEYYSMHRRGGCNEIPKNQGWQGVPLD